MPAREALGALLLAGPHAPWQQVPADWAGEYRQQHTQLINSIEHNVRETGIHLEKDKTRALNPP
jgi:hypothetical protein